MIDTQEFFSRQRRLAELDLKRLQASSALVLGLGNVGGPAALELARGGVGRLVLIDKDVVASANLSRGIFETTDIGVPKAIAAAARINALVPGVDVTALVADSRVDLPETLFSSCDAVLITTDSWSSRMHANRWAHALRGNTQVVISGGIRGLSWDVTSSVPGSGLGCAQCPHGAAIAGADEEGGCGIAGMAGSPRVDPSVSFVGAAVAAQMVTEACVSLGGGGPLFAGRMVSFEYEFGRHLVLAIARDPWCTGHRRLEKPEDYVVVPARDISLEDLAGRVALAIGAEASEVTFSTEREMLRSRTCRGCGARQAFHRAVVATMRLAGEPCGQCAGERFDFDVGTDLTPAGGTLASRGIPPGKAVNAHVRGGTIIVIRKDNEDALAQDQGRNG